VICALGGGEIGGVVNGKQVPVETTKIDQELINLTKKSSPKVLFLPTASGDNKGYISNFREYYSSL
jgi:dipeptidase E